MLNNCIICGKITKNKRYCSKKCNGIGDSEGYSGPKQGITLHLHICICCNEEFKSNLRYRKFCSLSCSTIYNNKLRKGNKNIAVKCSNCGKLISMTKGEMNKHLKRKYKNYFCSRICATDFKKGKTMPTTSRKLKLSYKKGLLQHKISHCGGFRKDLGIYVRSNWEANYARVLNYLNIEWIYEPKTFELNINNDIYTYTPDFYITKENKWIEIKGYWVNDISKLKFYKFKENHNIELIDLEKYSNICKQFKDKIIWEGRIYS